MAYEEIIFPNNIRNIRLASGLKMTELARLSNLSLSAVSKIEKGVRRLNEKQLLNICKLLNCKLSDIFIKESDDVAIKWQDEIKRRIADNEDSGLKIFGSGLRRIRQKNLKTIADAALAAGMTLSVYHKIETGQRELYQDEVVPLAQSFNLTPDEMFDEIANLYKSGALNKQINKGKERVNSVLIPGSPLTGINLSTNLYGSKLYDTARAKMAPVWGMPNARGIEFKKSDSTMIVCPMALEGRRGIYAVMPNTKRLNNILPEKCYIFADSETPATIGDMAVCIDSDINRIPDNTTAQIGMVILNPGGKTVVQLFGPDEKTTFKTMHRVVMIVME